MKRPLDPRAGRSGGTPTRRVENLINRGSRTVAVHTSLVAQNPQIEIPKRPAFVFVADSVPFPAAIYSILPVLASSSMAPKRKAPPKKASTTKKRKARDSPTPELPPRVRCPLTFPSSYSMETDILHIRERIATDYRGGNQVVVRPGTDGDAEGEVVTLCNSPRLAP